MTVVRTSFGELVLHSLERFGLDQEVTVLIRPDAARLPGEHPAEGECVIEGNVRGCSFRGSQTRLEVHHPADVDLVFDIASGGQRLPGPGEPISFSLRAKALSLLAEESRDQTASD